METPGIGFAPRMYGGKTSAGTRFRENSRYNVTRYKNEWLMKTVMVLFSFF
jgi:hypothetical protein